MLAALWNRPQVTFASESFIDELAAAVDDAVAKLGVEREARAYSPRRFVP